jgi:hypothetical protein
VVVTPFELLALHLAVGVVVAVGVVMGSASQRGQTFTDPPLQTESGRGAVESRSTQGAS